MIKRGEIYIVDLNPTIGSEINKKRPVIAISNNINNEYSDTITVIPVTSNVAKVYPFEVLIEVSVKNGLDKDSKAQCHQVRTISKLRFIGKALGSIDEKELKAINSALILHLGIE